MSRCNQPASSNRYILDAQVCLLYSRPFARSGLLANSTLRVAAAWVQWAGALEEIATYDVKQPRDNPSSRRPIEPCIVRRCAVLQDRTHGGGTTTRVDWSNCRRRYLNVVSNVSGLNLRPCLNTTTRVRLEELTRDSVIWRRAFCRPKVARFRRNHVEVPEHVRANSSMTYDPRGVFQSPVSQQTARMKRWDTLKKLPFPSSVERRPRRRRRSNRLQLLHEALSFALDL